MSSSPPEPLNVSTPVAGASASPHTTADGELVNGAVSTSQANLTHVRFHLEPSPSGATPEASANGQAATAVAPLLVAAPSSASSTSSSATPAAGVVKSVTAPDQTNEEQEEQGCTRAKTKETLLSLGFLFIILYPATVLLLMGQYYLYAKFTYRMVYAFAIIWLIYVAVLVTGLIVSWQIRERDHRIHLAELAAAEQAQQDKAALSLQIRLEEDEKKRQERVMA